MLSSTLIPKPIKKRNQGWLWFGANIISVFYKGIHQKTAKTRFLFAGGFRNIFFIFFFNFKNENEKRPGLSGLLSDELVSKKLNCST
jgi:hypothetical protein